MGKIKGAEDEQREFDEVAEYLYVCACVFYTSNYMYLHNID